MHYPVCLAHVHLSITLTFLQSMKVTIPTANCILFLLFCLKHLALERYSLQHEPCLKEMPQTVVYIQPLNYFLNDAAGKAVSNEV